MTPLQKLLKEIEASDGEMEIDIDSHLDNERRILELVYNKAHYDADNGIHDFDAFYDTISE